MTDDANHWPRLRENPIIIVLGFCAATAGATATLYEKVIIPYNVKVLETQVSELTQQLGSMPASLAEKDSVIATLRNENAALKLRALELSKDNVFSLDDPYPKTFRQVRIGDPFSKLEEVYPGKVTKDDPDNTLLICAEF